MTANAFNYPTPAVKGVWDFVLQKNCVWYHFILLNVGLGFFISFVLKMFTVPLIYK